MASIFGHGIVAFTISKALSSKSGKLLVFFAIVSAVIPDIDVLSFQFGIPYLHPLGHRGFTHSVMFAVIWSSILALSFGKHRKWLFFVVIILSTLSHGILDAMTTGGKGVGFFIPFDNSRYFFSERIIKVSPIGIDAFFSEWGLRVLWSEFKYILTPCIIVLGITYLVKKGRLNKKD
ncbi:MAG: metal-dependent hydrolase [Algicola sp.]|nr:metal-dependent hydrolase [Algicola sp.]